MQNVTSLVLSQSGAPLVIGNEIGDATSLTVAYTVAGNPLALTVSVLGVKKSAGEVAVLDSYVGTASTTRTITISDTFDFFRFIATWSGGQSVSVAASVTSQGAGAVFDRTSLTAIQTYSVS